MLEDCIRGEMDGSREIARGGGGGSRANVGDVVVGFGFAGTLDCPGPEPESRFIMAAGAVGGDRSGRCVDALEVRTGSSRGAPASETRARACGGCECSARSALGPVGAWTGVLGEASARSFSGCAETSLIGGPSAGGALAGGTDGIGAASEPKAGTWGAEGGGECW